MTTYNQYINMLSNHIAPYFDSRDITLDRVTAGDLEDYYTFKVAGGLNPNSVIKHHAIIHSALQWAVKHRYIRENTADFATKPTRIKYHGEEPYSVQEIAHLLSETAQQWALCGESYNTQYLDFVCVDLLGNLLQPDYVSQKFQQLLNYYDLRRIRYHDLRHSCATIMLYLGYSMKDIQTWLGHSNYNFTADTYVHSPPAAHA